MGGGGALGRANLMRRMSGGFYCSVVEYNTQPCLCPSSKSSLSFMVSTNVLVSEFALEGHDKVLISGQQ